MSYARAAMDASCHMEKNEVNGPGCKPDGPKSTECQNSARNRSKTKQTKGKKRNTTSSRPATDNQARISFLYQAAQSLSLANYSCLGRNLARNVDLVSKKSVTKLTPAMKRGICRRCHTNMVPGITQKTYIENLSSAKSPQNDVLVHRCCSCGKLKRFPIGKDMSYMEFAARES